MEVLIGLQQQGADDERARLEDDDDDECSSSEPAGGAIVAAGDSEPGKLYTLQPRVLLLLLLHRIYMRAHSSFFANFLSRASNPSVYQ